MTSKTAAAMLDLKTKLQSIAGLPVLLAKTPDDMGKKFKGIPPPAVGIIYEGRRTQGEQGNARVGIGTTVSFGLWLMYESPQIATGIDAELAIIELLDTMRKTISLTSSPAGHKWQFVFESFVDGDSSTSLWCQRWQTQIIDERQ